MPNHIVLAMLFTHPSYRRRGVARQLIDWGIREADRLGLEAFIEATDMGRPVYEAMGFTYMGINAWEPPHKENNEKSERWRELEEFFQTPIATYTMWRPKGGRFVKGETVVPWEKGGYG